MTSPPTRKDNAMPDNLPPELVVDSYDELRRRFGRRVQADWAGELERLHGHGAVLDAADRRVLGRSLVDHALADYARECLAAGSPLLAPEAEDELARAVVADVFGARALDRYLQDEAVVDICANGPDNVFVYYDDGRVERAPALARSDQELIELVQLLARESGQERRFDPAAVKIDLTLAEGSRLFAALGVGPWPVLAIRRHHFAKYARLAQLREAGTIDHGLEQVLACAVRGKLNTLVSGGTGTGKTTLARAGCNEMEAAERLVTAEDTDELGLYRFPDLHPNVVPLLVRPPNIEGRGEVGLAELTYMALRARPDRVIVGEVRGAEATPMCLAMTQGNDGSIGTIHASSSRHALRRLAMYIAFYEHVDPRAAYQLVGEAVHLVVHVVKRRLPGEAGARHLVTSVREVTKATEAGVESVEVFGPGPDRRAVYSGAAFQAETLELLEDAGFDRSLLQPGTWWR